MYEADKLESRKNQKNTEENIDSLMKEYNKKSAYKTFSGNFIAFQDTPITIDDNNLPSVVFDKINDDKIVAIENYHGKGELKSIKKNDHIC